MRYIKKILQKTDRGSFTVEAAFLYPILILLMAFLMNLAISWYGQVTEAASDLTAIQELDSLKEFQKAEQVKDMIQEVIP